MYLIISLVWVTICTHWRVQYPLSENLYLQVKMNEDSNDNRISCKYYILHYISYFNSCFYALTISLVSFVAYIEYFVT